MRVLILSASREIMHVMVPPIGEAYLTAYLISQGHEVKFIDLTLSDTYKNDITKAIDNFNPQVIGISIRNIDSTTYPGNLFFYLPVKSVINYIKDLVGLEIPIIPGGAGFSIFSEEILRDLDLNLGVFGEGEYVFAEILKYLEKKYQFLYQILLRQHNRLLARCRSRLPVCLYNGFWLIKISFHLQAWPQLH